MPTKFKIVKRTSQGTQSLKPMDIKQDDHKPLFHPPPEYKPSEPITQPEPTPKRKILLKGNTKKKIFLQPRQLEPKEQTRLNKLLASALRQGKIGSISQLLVDGASISYKNFDGICTAAEDGKFGVFQLLFNTFQVEQLIDQSLAKDLLNSARDYAEETGKYKLADFLEQNIHKCPEKIINENLAGFYSKNDSDDED